MFFCVLKNNQKDTLTSVYFTLSKSKSICNVKQKEGNGRRVGGDSKLLDQGPSAENVPRAVTSTVCSILQQLIRTTLLWAAWSSYGLQTDDCTGLSVYRLYILFFSD